MGKLNWGLVAVVLAVLVTLILLFLAAYRVAPDATRVKDALWTMQAAVTTLAILVGAVFAAYKWQVFRESEPHLTIKHDISHRPIGESYVHVAVTAMLHNSSKVHIELLKGFCRIQQIAPVSDADIELLYAQVFEDKVQTHIQWRTLEQVWRNWDKDETVVEPGESHPETFEFVVSKDIESVVIYTYFYNSKYSQRTHATEGWHATTVHDIIEA